MKKIITICLIVVTLLAGDMTATAKTTTTSRHSTSKSKSSSKASGLTINDFCYKEDGRRYLLKDNLQGIVESKGFKLVGSERYLDDMITSEDYNVLCERRTYKKGGITIVLEIAIEEGYIGNDAMTIKFASSAEKKNFIKSATSIGFKKAKSNFYHWGKDYESGICIFVKGNDVILGYLGD